MCISKIMFLVYWRQVWCYMNFQMCPGDDSTGVWAHRVCVCYVWTLFPRSSSTSSLFSIKEEGCRGWASSCKINHLQRALSRWREQMETKNNQNKHHCRTAVTFPVLPSAGLSWSFQTRNNVTVIISLLLLIPNQSHLDISIYLYFLSSENPI